MKNIRKLHIMCHKDPPSHCLRLNVMPKVNRPANGRLTARSSLVSVSSLHVLPIPHQVNYRFIGWLVTREHEQLLWWVLGVSQCHRGLAAARHDPDLGSVVIKKIRCCVVFAFLCSGIYPKYSCGNVSPDFSSSLRTPWASRTELISATPVHAQRRDLWFVGF